MFTFYTIFHAKNQQQQRNKKQKKKPQSNLAKAKLEQEGGPLGTRLDNPGKH